MIYLTEVTAPANTTEAGAITETVRLGPGVLTLLEIDFPLGCAGLVSCQIAHWDVKRWPSSPDDAFSGNGVNLSYQERFLLDREPYEMDVKVWNLDDRFEHTLTFRFQVVDQKDNLLDVIRRAFAFGI